MRKPNCRRIKNGAWKSRRVSEQIPASRLDTGNHGIHELIVDPSLNAFDIGLGVLPATVPDARFSEVQFADTHSVSNYNGMTASFTQRIHGWGEGIISANYTWSHAFDEVSNGGLLPFVYSTNISPLTPQIPGNYRNNYGPADYDVRNYSR